jgi:hypothetical protein
VRTAPSTPTPAAIQPVGFRLAELYTASPPSPRRGGQVLNDKNLDYASLPIYSNNPVG